MSSLIKSVSADELARHKATSAVAQRIALHEATIALDAVAKRIERDNLGRRKGTVTVAGQQLAAIAKECADLVWAIHQTVDVPQVGGPWVHSDVHRREAIEGAVARLSPGSYPPPLRENPNVP